MIAEMNDVEVISPTNNPNTIVLLGIPSKFDVTLEQTLLLRRPDIITYGSTLTYASTW